MWQQDLKSAISVELLLPFLLALYAILRFMVIRVERGELNLQIILGKSIIVITNNANLTQQEKDQTLREEEFATLKIINPTSSNTETLMERDERLQDSYRKNPQAHQGSEAVEGTKW